MFIKPELAYWSTKSGKIKAALAKGWETSIRRRLMSGRLPSRNSQKVVKGVYLSLTTWGPRLNVVPLTLLTLTQQTLLPERTVVWITDADLRNFSTQFRNIFESHGIEFCTCEDFGPHKKWFHTRAFGADATVVLADDDVFYAKTWFENLVTEFKDKSTYLANRCHEITHDGHRVHPYSSWKRESRDYGRCSHLMFATGCGGVIFKPAWIPNDFWDEILIRRLCPKADDIWLKCAMLNAGKEVLNSSTFLPILGPGIAAESGLEKINVHNDYNTKQMTDVLHHFSLENTILKAKA